MGTTHPTLLSKNTLAISFLMTLFAIASALVIAPSAGAIGVASVSPTKGTSVELSQDQGFVFTFNATTNAGETLSHLEVDHSFEGQPWFPEFNIYANEANPYGGTAQQAYANGVGVTVTYSASLQQWVVDFGPTVTQNIIDDGGEIIFYLALHGNDAASDPITWGQMGPPLAENTFNYSLVRSNAPDNDQAAPGVPNTATADGSHLSIALVASASAVVMVTAGLVTIRRFAKQ